MSEEGVHVVVGRGPLGKAVVKALLADGKSVRVIGQTDQQSGFSPAVEERTYDVSQAEQAKKAFQGASVVYQCAAPPYSKWTELYADLTEGIIAGAHHNNARLVVGDNLYMYGEVSGLMDESLPYHAITRKGMVRAHAAERLSEAHQQGETEVAIGRGSDFFGPHAVNSAIGRVFPNIVAGKKATVVGSLDQPHTYTFIDDFGRALVILGENDRAFGEIWHVPNAPTLTTRQFLTKAYELAGYEPNMKAMSNATLKLGGLFNASAREIIELLYQFEKPFIVDDTKFTEAFGDWSTGTEEALQQTISWFREAGEKR